MNKLSACIVILCNLASASFSMDLSPIPQESQVRLLSNGKFGDYGKFIDNNAIYLCKLCLIGFANIEGYRHHILTGHIQSNMQSNTTSGIQCTSCQEIMTEGLHNHYKQAHWLVTTESNIYCGVCNKRYSRQDILDDLARHAFYELLCIQTPIDHSNSYKRIPNNIPTTETTNESMLFKNDSTPLLCYNCKQTFSDLPSHIQFQHHELRGESIICTYHTCAKTPTALTMDELENHMEIHRHHDKLTSGQQ